MDDIYIDCQPLDIIGEPTNIYLSKNLDNLKIGQIDHFNLWLFRFLTVFVVIGIVYLVVKMFGYKSSQTAPAAANDSGSG